MLLRLHSKFYDIVFTVQIVKEFIGMVTFTKQNKGIIDITFIKVGFKFSRAIVKPNFFVETHKIFAKVGPSGRPIPNPSICL
jgi:hypothetical protein